MIEPSRNTAKGHGITDGTKFMLWGWSAKAPRTWGTVVTAVAKEHGTGYRLQLEDGTFTYGVSPANRFWATPFAD